MRPVPPQTDVRRPPGFQAGIGISAILPLSDGTSSWNTQVRQSGVHWNTTRPSIIAFATGCPQPQSNAIFFGPRVCRMYQRISSALSSVAKATLPSGSKNWPPRWNIKVLMPQAPSKRRSIM
jgi:hypothetical protein